MASLSHRLFERFTPPGADEELKRRCAVQIGFVAIVFIATLGTAPLEVLNHHWHSILAESIAVAVLLMTLRWLRQGRVELAGHAASAVIILALEGIAAAKGGVGSTELAWVAGSLMLAVLLVGPRGGIFWVAISSAAAFAQAMTFEPAQWSVPRTSDLSRPFSYAAEMSLLYAACWAVATVFDRARAGYVRRLNALVEESRRLATTDVLTGLLNRRAGGDALAAALARSQDAGAPFSILLLDVDHFKLINDGRGHAAGDSVLAAIGAMLLHETRAYDVRSRWGGEEFVLALAGADGVDALAVANRLRLDIEHAVMAAPDGDPIAATASVGVACRRSGETLDALLDRADRAMYNAKTSGRNRACLSGSEPSAALRALPPYRASSA